MDEAQLQDKSSNNGFQKSNNVKFRTQLLGTSLKISNMCIYYKEEGKE